MAVIFAIWFEGIVFHKAVTQQQPIALKRRTTTEILWNRKETSRRSPDSADVRLPRSLNKRRVSIFVYVVFCFREFLLSSSVSMLDCCTTEKGPPLSYRFTPIAFVRRSQRVYTRLCGACRRSSGEFSEQVRRLRDAVRSCDVRRAVETQARLLRHQSAGSEHSLLHSHGRYAHAASVQFGSSCSRSLLSRMSSYTLTSFPEHTRYTERLARSWSRYTGSGWL